MIPDITMTDGGTSLPPPLTVRWFHAIDNPIIDPIAIRKAKRTKSTQLLSATTKKVSPKNWVAFSKRDTCLLEKTYQQTVADSKNGKANRNAISLIPVNEDYLFQVDVVKRQISPIYWEGPVYAVRRATWFLQHDSSTFVPVEEALADQIENGYLKLKPYNKEKKAVIREHGTSEHETQEKRKCINESEQQKIPPTGPVPKDEESVEEEIRESLKGIYQGQYVIYKTPAEAFLYYDETRSNAAIAFFTKFTGSSKTGVRIVRGFDQVERETKKPSSGVMRKSSLASAISKKDEAAADAIEHMRETSERKYRRGDDRTLSAEDEEKERMEHLKEDYDNEESEEEVRKIDQLVFVIHGIGQQMSERITGQNFVHDVNILRKTLKSAWFTASNLATETKTSVNGIQVIPILWRKSILFGEDAEDVDDGSNKESDIGIIEHERDDGCPTLEEITLDGAPNIRTLVSDVFLDVPLYLTEKYHDLMIQIVTKEINRVYKLFIEKNPYFLKNNGQVHILAHSLGSLLAFDILCAQPMEHQQKSTFSFWRSTASSSASDLNSLDFPIKNFFALGSPLGMMLLLRSNKVVSRKSAQSNSVLSSKTIDLTRCHSTNTHTNTSNISSNNVTFVYPAIDNMYNIFHKSDPVAYRVEPLVARHYGSKLKPVPIPYLKGGLKSMLDASFNVAANKAGAVIDSFKSTGMFMRSLGGYFSSSTSTVSSTSTTTEGNSTFESSRRDAAFSDSPTDYLSTTTTTTTTTTARIETCADRDAQKLKLLNSTGRIDYCLQEGLLENAYLSALSVHMSYWQDMDVAGFLIRELYASNK